jgi:hypothetical protein
VFLARFGDRFEDVTAQIRSGERGVQFFCARASPYCRQTLAPVARQP